MSSNNFTTANVHKFHYVGKDFRKAEYFKELILKIVIFKQNCCYFIKMKFVFIILTIFKMSFND